MDRMDVDDDAVMDLSAGRQSRREVGPVDGTLDLSAKPGVEPRAAPAPVVVPVPLGLNLPLSLSAIPLMGSTPSPSGSAGSPLPTSSVTLSPVPATAAVAPVAAPLTAPPTIEPGTMEPPASRSLLNPRVMRELDDRYPRRSLRPRQEIRNYQESPDVIVLSDEEPRINGYTNGFESDSSDPGEVPPLHPIKELSPAEVEERERTLRKLREELRNEEMKLVLLKKLRQSQQMKENIAVTPSSGSATQASTNSGSATSLTTSSSGNKVSSSGKPLSSPGHSSSERHQQQPHAAHQQVPQALIRGHPNKPSPAINQPIMRGPPSVRSQNLPPPLLSQHGRSTTTPQLPPNTTLTPTNMSRSGNSAIRNLSSLPFVNNRDRTKDAHHSPVGTSGTPTAQERVRLDDNQTPAQRQAAAKLALRKQLEETLLQIPPPKPPPPEMHFIPNPSNTEFIYLLGLEHVVDFITKDNKTPPPPEPFKCSQCQTNFTPVWKWEKSPSKGKEPKVICESCVTTNVKKALKAEHTNRLKTAFVKALQQEQEIEQRLAQASSGASPQPEPATITLHPAPAPAPSPAPKAATPTRHNPTPPAPVAATAPPARTPPLSRDHSLSKLASSDASKYGQSHGHGLHGAAAAAAMALHHQLLQASTRGGGLPQHNPSHPLLQFSPLLYQYQLAMAQAAGGKGSVAAAAANLAEFQRQAETLQRQYLMEMIPPHTQNPSASSRSHNHGHHTSMNNWKT